MGWEENDGSDETYTSFTMGSLRLALFPIELLGKEAAPRDQWSRPDVWNGVTLGVNVATREDVDDAFAAAVAAGAEAIQSPIERSWGGYSGYFADPEGHRWELALGSLVHNLRRVRRCRARIGGGRPDRRLPDPRCVLRSDAGPISHVGTPAELPRPTERDPEGSAARAWRPRGVSLRLLPGTVTRAPEERHGQADLRGECVP